MLGEVNTQKLLWRDGAKHNKAQCEQLNTSSPGFRAGIIRKGGSFRTRNFYGTCA